jgi:hypothetical protein
LHNKINPGDHYVQCIHFDGGTSVDWMHFLHTCTDCPIEEHLPDLKNVPADHLFTDKYTCIDSQDPDLNDTMKMATKLLATTNLVN